MGTDWTPERDALIAEALALPGGPTFGAMWADVRDLRAAWLTACQERDAALARAERTERWRDETYRDGRWIDLQVERDAAVARAERSEAELASYAEVKVDGRTLAEWRSVGVTEPWKRRMTRADVEAALAVAYRERPVQIAMASAALAKVSIKPEQDSGDGAVMTGAHLALVCAVLGVPDAE